MGKKKHNTSKKINKKKNKPKPKGTSVFSAVKNSVSRFFKNPLNAIVFKFAGLMLLFYACWISPFFQTQIVENVAKFYASASGSIIKLFNYPVLIVGDTLGYSNFSISIKNGCDAIEATAILLCGILVYPSKWKYKGIGLLVGLVILVIINLVRIISLFFNGIYIPSIFELMHTGVWQVLFIIFPVVIIFRWIKWINEQQNFIPAVANDLP